MSPAVRILFVGDMHLGRLPTHLAAGATLSEFDLSVHDLSSAAAWDNIVREAVKHQVHAVALAGDLVESSNARFEAYGLLESGLRRLEQAKIPVVAVAGNHDTEILPELAEKIASLTLLGPDGTWTSKTIPGDDDLAVQIAGWSFPQKHVASTPLPPVGLPDDPVHPIFGLLHADLDQSGSQYAPVTSDDLNRTGFRAWFLGHVHGPGEPRTDGRPFYLGSVNGLHPGETGLHGPVEVHLDARGELTAQRLPLAPLRWENLAVSCDILDEDNKPGKLILNSLTNWAVEHEDDLELTRAVGFRLTLTGFLEHPEELRIKLLEDVLHPHNLTTSQHGTVLFVDRIINRVRQRLDLREMARTNSPEGLLARRILVLENTPGIIPGVENPEAIRQQLLTRAKEEIDTVNNRAIYGRLKKPVDPEETRRLLLQAGRRALEAILDQRRANHAAD